MRTITQKQMTSKLTLNDEIRAFLDTEEKLIWEAIIANNTADISSLLAEKGDSLVVGDIITELLSEGKSDTLENHDFVSIKEENSPLLKNLVRLIFALDVNGEHEDKKLYISDKLFDIIPDIVNNLKEQAKGYPRTSINALVWVEGAGMRSSLNALIYYYRLKDNAEALHFLIMNRTQITLAIMGHYKNIVGPDMIEAARIKERMGNTDAAISFYKAVDADFRNELNWFTSTPEAGPNEEDVVILESLKEALTAIDRLSETDEYSSICQQIDEVLSREHIEIPDFDDEDDDE